MRKLFSLNSLKDLRKIPVFGLTLIIGLWLAGAFEAYHFHFYIEKRFTAEEGARLIGKKVLVGLPTREKKTGTVVGFTASGNVEICCTTYERQENVKTQFGKSAFDGYVTVLDE